MSLARKLKKWWKVKTGKDDSPLDGETPYWIFSLLLHAVLLVVLASMFVERQTGWRVSVTVPAETGPELVDLPTIVDIEYTETAEIGNNANSSFMATMDLSPQIDQFADTELNQQLEHRELGEFNMSEYIPEDQVAPDFNSIAVRGVAGHATNGTTGAVDRITHEILMSLEERKTLVVWMFDQSASLLKQKDEILRRFDSVYEELSELTGTEVFKKHGDQPLLTHVYAFGSQHTPMLPRETSDLDSIKQAVRDISVDESGIENVFGAVADIASDVRKYCKIDRKTGQRERNVMFVILSDESGDDTSNLDAAVEICRNHMIRVYVVGIPAPFGREHTFVKWVDPDPQFDQSVQWAPVRQGPESIMPERIKLHFTTIEQQEELFDSGFGPFGLTRLCYQSGGMYFTVHPNRNTEGRIPRWQTSTYSAHLSKFFDPDTMRRYRPDYVSVNQYRKQLLQNQARLSLVNTAHISRVRPMSPPQLRFEKLDEATFVNQVSRAQRAAAVLEPKINELYDTLKKGEHDRQKEISLRWKAGYDLAMGRVLAVKIRAETYNKLLAMAKTKLKFNDPKNNTWILRPSNEISVDGQTRKAAEKARMFLQRVADEHPNTPWALLATNELKQPLGWKWSEAHTEPPQPREQMRRPNNNNNNRRRNPQPNNQPPRKTKRPPPKL